MSDLLNDPNFLVLLSKDIVNEWKTVGRYLFIEEVVLETIERLHARLTLHEMPYQMLLSWKKENPKRTIEDLKSALKNSKRNDLVIKITQNYGKSFTMLSLFWFVMLNSQ